MTAKRSKQVFMAIVDVVDSLMKAIKTVTILVVTKDAIAVCVDLHVD